ncbi:MAG: hypothetical protein AAGF95_32630 [Chloroflexota bacterium]
MSPLRELIAEKADLTVTQFQDRVSGTLDFSQTSLDSIEELLGDAADFIDVMSDDTVDALVELVGSYILEVAARAFEGTFFWHQQHDQPVFVTGEPDAHIAIITFDKVRGRLNGDEGDNIPFFYAGFASRAASPAKGTQVLYV